VQGYTNSGFLAFDLFNVDEEGRIRLGERDKFVAEEVAAKYSKFILKRNDLVIVMTDMTQRLGILGKCCMIDADNKYILNQRMGRIVADEGLIKPRYLRYYINSEHFLRPLHALAKGAVQKYVNTGDIKGNLVLVPPLETQERIVSYLSAYDDLIENNARRIKIVEQMVHMLYREWFVNFRFPGRHKVKMTDSEIGMIPAGWSPRSIGFIAEEVRSNVQPNDLDPETPYIGLEHMPRQSIALSEWGVVGQVESTKLRFNKGEILFGKIRPYFHKVGVAPLEGVCSSDAIVIRPKKEEWHTLVLCCVSSKEFVSQATQTSQGTKMPRANWTVLTRYPVALPDEMLLNRFNKIVQPAIDLIQNLVFQNRNLRRTRDLL
jgi:type I restriction enzyme S subunit